MRFTKEKTEEINNCYNAIRHDTFLPLDIYNDVLCTHGVKMCDLHDLTKMIESLVTLKAIIEEHTDVIM